MTSNKNLPFYNSNPNLHSNRRLMGVVCTCVKIHSKKIVKDAEFESGVNFSSAFKIDIQLTWIIFYCLGVLCVKERLQIFDIIQAAKRSLKIHNMWHDHVRSETQQIVRVQCFHIQSHISVSLRNKNPISRLSQKDVRIRYVWHNMIRIVRWKDCWSHIFSKLQTA
jgi:hypothetical protein